MKKMIMMLAMFASICAMASTDVYTFKATVKYPAIKSTKTFSYRQPAATTLNGTLTVDYDDENPTNLTSTLEVVLKKTGETFTYDLDTDTTVVLLGKTGTTPGMFINTSEEESTEGGKLQFAAAGYGSGKMKTTTTGCGPCGDTSTTSCYRVTKVSGNIVGMYTCPCENPQFDEWLWTCDGIDLDATNTAPINGTWSLSLKTVNGKKW